MTIADDPLVLIEQNTTQYAIYLSKILAARAAGQLLRLPGRIVINLTMTQIEEHPDSVPSRKLIVLPQGYVDVKESHLANALEPQFVFAS